LSAFGSSTDSVTFEGSLGYVLGNGEGLADAFGSGRARLENGRVVDQELEARLRGATPDVLLGRFVLYADWSARRNDTSRTQITLGGDNGLRGYAAGAFRVTGGNRLRMNVEYRTLPLVIQSVHVGGVLFYDVGTVYGTLSSAQAHQGIGAGLRILFSQFNPRPFGIDFGVPLDRHGFSVLVSYSSEQAVPLTASEDALGASVRPR
jgi:hemolysin activation/secretion protein